jgi:xanthine/uracil permease
MKSRKKLIILAVLLILSIGNYSRISINDEIRSVHFISIFALGAISALFLQEVILTFKNR